MTLTTILQRLGFQPVDLDLDVPTTAVSNKGNDWLAVTLEPSPEQAERALEALRQAVNARYPVPRALRIQAPHMMLVCLSPGPSPELRSWVERHRTSTIWGGEVFHPVLVELGTGTVTAPAAYSTVERMRRAMFRPEATGRAFLEVLIDPGYRSHPCADRSGAPWPLRS
jgi:hypothetical protein